MTIGAMVTAVAAMLMVASPANAATQSGQCSIGGYNFVGSVTTSGTHLFTGYHVGYLTSNPVGLEWRVRFFNGDGSLKWDSGYQFYTDVNQYTTNSLYVLTSGGSRALVQIGRTNDGYPTCTALDVYGM